MSDYIERDFSFILNISPAIREMVGDENLEGLRPAVIGALKVLESLDWSRLPPVTSAEAMFELGYALRAAVTDNDGSILDMGFMIDLPNSRISVVFPHEQPRIFASLAQGEYDVYGP